MHDGCYRCRFTRLVGMQAYRQRGLCIQRIGHVAAELFEELRARAGRDPGRHLQHSRLHAAPLLLRAQRDHAVGKVVRQFLQQARLFGGGLLDGV